MQLNQIDLCFYTWHPIDPCFRAKDLSTPNFDFDNFGLDIAILYV